MISGVRSEVIIYPDELDAPTARGAALWSIMWMPDRMIRELFEMVFAHKNQPTFLLYYIKWC